MEDIPDESNQNLAWLLNVVVSQIPYSRSRIAEALTELVDNAIDVLLNPRMESQNILLVIKTQPLKIDILDTDILHSFSLTRTDTEITCMFKDRNGKPHSWCIPREAARIQVQHLTHEN